MSKQKNDFKGKTPYKFTLPQKIAVDVYGNPRQTEKLLGIIKKNAHGTEKIGGDDAYYLLVDGAQIDQPNPCVLMAKPNLGKEMGYVIKYLD